MQDSNIPLNPNKLNSQRPGQGGTHHVGHIRRGSTLQQSLDDGQVPHEGSHMQGGQAGLGRERGQKPKWDLMALPMSLTVPSFSPGQVSAEAKSAPRAWQMSVEETQGPAVPPAPPCSLGRCCQAKQVLS